MDLITIEYEVKSIEGVSFINTLHREGYGIKLLQSLLREKRPPETLYFQVWGDGQVTWDYDRADMPEIKAVGFTSVMWSAGQAVEPIKVVSA